jgi:hypothetical protein
VVETGLNAVRDPKSKSFVIIGLDSFSIFGIQVCIFNRFAPFFHHW